MHLSRTCKATIKMSKTTMRIIIRIGTEYTAFSLTKHITPSADPFLLVKYEYCKQFVMSQILFAFYVKTKNYGYIYTTCNAFFRDRYPNICNIQDINCIRGSQKQVMLQGTKTSWHFQLHAWYAYLKSSKIKHLIIHSI